MRKFAGIAESSALPPPPNCVWVKEKNLLTCSNGMWNPIVDGQALDNKCPKPAYYVATKDLNSLPITEGIIDLNGYNISADFKTATGNITIQNGIINRIEKIVSGLSIYNCTITSTYISSTQNCTIRIYSSKIKDLGILGECRTVIYNSDIDTISLEDRSFFEISNSHIRLLTNSITGFSSGHIYNSYIETISSSPDVQVTEIYNYIRLFNSTINNIDLSNYDDSTFRIELIGSTYADCFYIYGTYYADNEECLEEGYCSELDNVTGNAPQTRVVFKALQLKADKTALNNYVTTTTATNTYLSKIDASNTYATSTRINNLITSLPLYIDKQLDGKNWEPLIFYNAGNSNITLTIARKSKVSGKLCWQFIDGFDKTKTYTLADLSTEINYREMSYSTDGKFDSAEITLLNDSAVAVYYVPDDKAAYGISPNSGSSYTHLITVSPDDTKLECYGDIMAYIGVLGKERPALSSYCFTNMFYGCKSLIVAPKLPMTELANSCYETMFLGCKSLINAPELPATALEPWCYSGMFSACKSLVTAKIMAITSSDSAFKNMFQNVNTTNGVLKVNKAKTYDISEISVPTEWTIEEVEA